MRKIIYFFFLTTFYNLSSAQFVNIPDANFKNVLLTENVIDTDSDSVLDSDLDVNNDNEIDFTEALLLKQLNLGNRNISDLTGLNSFTELEILYVLNNPVANIPISNLNKLIRLYCSQTTTTVIDLCGTQVTLLHCYDMPNLTTINLKNNYISPDLFFGNSGNIPPLGLPSIMMNNVPNLNSICYDVGEGTAVNNALYNLPNSVSLTTTCTTSCYLGVSDNFYQTNLQLYPNPVMEKFFINLNLEVIESVKIYDLFGKSFSIQGQENTFDISNLQKGIYFVEICTSDNKKYVEKIIKD